MTGDHHDADDPWPRLRRWLAPGGALAQTLMLATATPGGAPSLRVVALRGLDDRGLHVFTHGGSRKVRELERNGRFAAALHFDPHPEGGHRQLRLEGAIEWMPRDRVERYFATRPRAAQLSAAVSRQGEPSPGVAALRAAQAALDDALGPAAVPCPADFVGLVLLPAVIEFWRGASDRLHERWVHRREGATWRAEALQP
ncbi:MAG: pyridoxal 5'-phosphate synthase [Nannocystaceae bacterium]|nr:pyridoxal 5'-phosphate synthase [Nannocystaceae bacterium]